MPRWKELKKYLDNNGWILYKNTDHYYYKKIEKWVNVIARKK